VAVRSVVVGPSIAELQASEEGNSVIDCGPMLVLISQSLFNTVSLSQLSRHRLRGSLLSRQRGASCDAFSDLSVTLCICTIT